MIPVNQRTTWKFKFLGKRYLLGVGGVRVSWHRDWAYSTVQGLS
jgi:hypothetical protein